MRRAAVIDNATNTVVNVIIADAQVDFSPYPNTRLVNIDDDDFQVFVGDLYSDEGGFSPSPERQAEIDAEIEAVERHGWDVE